MMLNLSPVLKVVRHAFRAFPLLYAVMLLGIVSVIAEVSAAASLFPLAEMAVGRGSQLHGVWRSVAAVFPDRNPMMLFLLLFLALLLLRVLTASTVLLLYARHNRKLIAQFSANAFGAFVQHLSFKEMHEKSIGHFITLAGDEANRAAQIVIAVVRLVPTSFAAFLYLAALFVFSRPLGFAVAGFLGVMGLAMIGAFRRSHDLGVTQQTQSRALNTFFLDVMIGLRSVRAFGAEGYAATRYREMIDEYVWTCFKVDAVNVLGRSLPAIALLAIALVASALWLDEATVSRHLAFALAATVLILRFFPAVGQAVDIFMRLTADLRAGQNVADVVEVEAYAAGREHEMTRTEPIERIEFDHVNFSYADGTPVLVNFSARFEAGRTYAVAGPSGSGKSTLMDLLLGFYAPQSGSIRVNGSAVGSAASRGLRSRIAIVEQQARILNDTIRHNLLFGRAAGEPELSRALSAAKLDEVIRDLPLGIDTQISFQGSNLSGGQRQRLSIARALVKDVDVLILDESTNGLDGATRDQLIANLRVMFRGKILILLTHDKELLSRADEVVVLAPVSAPPEQNDILPVATPKHG